VDAEPCRPRRNPELNHLKITMASYVIGFFALMVALVAIYQRQAREAGTFGLVALCVAIAGTMDTAGNMWFDAFVGPLDRRCHATDLECA
jgi:uncharacterized membrane-anchored protein